MRFGVASPTSPKRSHNERRSAHAILFVMAATRSRITAEEYLALPHDEPPWLEYFRGEVIEKPLPNADHSEITVTLIRRFGAHADTHGGRVHTEARTRFDDSLEGPSFMLPDISYYVPGTRFRDGQMLLPPALGIEVRSPGQSNAYYTDRVGYFLDHGVSEVWVVDPARQSVSRYVAGIEAEVVGSGRLESHAAPGFAVDVEELFSGLDDEIA
jgi:Uma2 family endonuclease